jgi:flavin reductase (DIM6/NTAB) family NADH-FMN oxidoreductase RutF
MDVTATATLFAWLDRELWLVTAQAEGRRGGLIATSVSQASHTPDLPRVLVGLAKPHYTWELVEASQAFALHLLSEANLDLIGKFGLVSGRDVDKFAGLEVQSAVTGSPLLGGTVGWLDCKVEASLDIGDRTLYLAEVVQGCVTHFGPPLTTQQLMETAPTALLTKLQQKRHQDSYRETELIELWRVDRGLRRPGETFRPEE